MRIGYKKVKTLIVDPKKLFFKWAAVELKSSLHLTPCPNCLVASSNFKLFVNSRIYNYPPSNLQQPGLVNVISKVNV